jgi:26S proteasome regulatory subunit N2
MDAVLDTGFSLSYRDQVLHKLLPLFPSPTTEAKSPHVHALTRLLVTLSKPSLTVPLLTSLVPHEKLLAYQFAFDLVEGGAQDFLESVRNELPEGDEVRVSFSSQFACTQLCGPAENQGYIRQIAQYPGWPGVREAIP